MSIHQEAICQIVLETRSPKKGDVYPVKLRVTYQRTQRYYGVSIDLSKEEFKLATSPRPKEPYKTIKFKLLAHEQKGIEIISKMETFTFAFFKSEFIGKTSSKKDVFHSFEKYIENLFKENRIGTANSYKCAYVSLQKFKNTMSFAEVTPQLLQNYESYMIAKGVSVTTIGIYLRSLRTIVNLAIQNKIISVDSYPFGKNRYQIPSGRNIKKALTIEEIEKVYNYDTIEGTPEDKAKSFWVLSYLLNGINMKDLCLLKYKNMSGDRISFIRSKTQRSRKKDLSPIVVILTKQSISLINKLKANPIAEENLIFDILSKDQSAIEQDKKLHQFIKTTNKYMKRIAEDLKINKPLTTYVARHSFSTVLKRSGAPIEFISEALGHSNITTTQSYLDSFEDDSRRKYTNALLNFEKTNE